VPRRFLSRRLVPAALAAFALLVPSVPPAAALGSFGPVTEVYDPDCRAADVSGDAAVGSDGVVRGFTVSSGGSCPASPAIRYFELDGADVVLHTTSQRGDIVAVASDTTGVYLLYQAGDGSLRLIKRRSNGTMTTSRVLSRVAEGGPVEGDLVASGGSWWAVWTEPRGHGVTLNQARTIGTDVKFQRLANNGGLELSPSLALRPGNQVAMAWSRAGSIDSLSVELWVASTDSTGRWRSRPFELAPLQSGLAHLLPSIAAHGSETYLAWQANERIVVATNDGGTWRSKVFMTPGAAPSVSTSQGKVFVGFTSLNSPGRAFLAQRNATWTGAFVSPRTPYDQLMAGTFAARGKVTALMLSPTRLYARSQP
jgi:hypothetical protein